MALVEVGALLGSRQLDMGHSGLHHGGELRGAHRGEEAGGKDFVEWYDALEHEFDGWYGIGSKIGNNKVTYGTKYGIDFYGWSKKLGESVTEKRAPALHRARKVGTLRQIGNLMERIR